GTSVTYSFVGSHEDLVGADSGNGSMAGTGWVSFENAYTDDGWTTVTVTISALGCSKTITINHPL
ncbi:MAG: hypothetical protein ACYDH2_14760, partial [Anaerolineaceae bacterium]